MHTKDIIRNELNLSCIVPSHPCRQMVVSCHHNTCTKVADNETLMMVDFYMFLAMVHVSCHESCIMTCTRSCNARVLILSWYIVASTLGTVVHNIHVMYVWYIHAIRKQCESSWSMIHIYLIQRRQERTCRLYHGTMRRLYQRLYLVPTLLWVPRVAVSSCYPTHIIIISYQYMCK